MSLGLRARVSRPGIATSSRTGYAAGHGRRHHETPGRPMSLWRQAAIDILDLVGLACICALGVLATIRILTRYERSDQP